MRVFGHIIRGHNKFIIEPHGYCNRACYTILSVFEHVIVKEVELAVERRVQTGETVNEFTVAPKFKKGSNGLSRVVY